MRLSLIAVLLFVGLPATAQKDGEWPTYAADLAGSRYRPLDQISGAELQQARRRVALQDR